MKLEKYLVEIGISIMFLVLLLYSSDPVLYDDSIRYLTGSPKDLPLYSAVIQIMQKNIWTHLKDYLTFLILGMVCFQRQIQIRLGN